MEHLPTSVDIIYGFHSVQSGFQALTNAVLIQGVLIVYGGPLL